ncbi:MAG TPA: OmpA family protein [Blastocatellia bacterium]|nr:OmpA family protein [Blastocatellia bacterium]
MRKSLTISFGLMMLALCALQTTALSQGGDLRRHTIAITYFKDPVSVTMAGTNLRPNAKGEATVERWRKRNESEIDIKIENMVPAYTYGGDYTTFVLWAITPAGQADNLGEFRLKDGKAQLKAATPNQSFAMIITAEPHFMVKLPSSKVILENLAPASKNVQIQSSEIFFNGDPGNYYKDTTLPQVVERDFLKTPQELIQARRAVQIAKLADGERYDPEDYSQAVGLLRSAEEAFRTGANVHDVGRISRDAISLAVRVRDVSEERAVAAERRAEIQRRDAEIRRANDTASDLNTRLSELETQFKASEMARVNAQDQLDRAMHEASDARAENRQLRSENDRLSRELSEAKVRVNELESKFSNASEQLSTSSNQLAEMQRQEQARREYAAIQTSLGGIVTVKPSGNGFVATLPDSFFLPNKTMLQVRAKDKMDALAQVIGAHKGVVFSIVGNWDASPTADAFAMGRAQAVADYIAAYGVPKTSFKIESRGSSMLISRGKTVAARAANRRVELVFVAP